jgi:hypothetical protein
MSFDAHYPNRKDRRKQYSDTRQFDKSCRSHGDCPWCQGKRKYKHKRRLPIVED